MEMTTTTTEKILTAIEHQRVRPRPKWHFVLRNSILWIPGIITTVLGAYTIAGLIYGILHGHPNQLLMIAAIPLLWVVSFFIFCLISTSFLRNTYTGYRHTTLQLLLVSVASSIILGILFYAITQNTEDNMVRTYYRYPTQHQDDYFERNVNVIRMN